MNSVSHRRPLDERLHERDLEAAIILSMLDNTDQDQSPTSTGKGYGFENLRPKSIIVYC